MEPLPLKLVTVIAEAVLEDKLLREMRELGATGHSLSELRGEGSRGVRASEWEGKNIKVEVLASPETADRILTHVAATYFRHYAVVAYVTDVGVVRGEKYT